MKVRQQIKVTRHADHFGAHGILLVRDVQMGALPYTGEEACIELYYHAEGGPGSGPMAYVRRRYWDSTGLAYLQLPDLHIDPQGALFDHFQRRRLDHGIHLACLWSTDRDPDPVPLMLASGWVEET